MDPEDVSRELPLSDVVLLQEVSLQLELLLQQRVGQSHLRRSSKPGGQPGSAVSVRLPGTQAAVRVSQEARLQVLGSDGSSSQVRHGTVVSLQV